MLHRVLKIGRIAGIVAATFVACLAILYLSIPMENTGQSHFDVILVLGSPAEPNGSIAPFTRSRVLEAIRQYRAGTAPYLLMSGGAAHNRFVEAQVMAEFAEAEGVPSKAVYVEGQSLDTIQNAYYSYRVMQAHGWQSALIVSTPEHLRRASLIFRGYPFAWRMQAAPWPQVDGWAETVRLWSNEIFDTVYLRIFGLPHSRFVPRSDFSPVSL